MSFKAILLIILVATALRVIDIGVVYRNGRQSEIAARISWSYVWRLLSSLFGWYVIGPCKCASRQYIHGFLSRSTLDLDKCPVQNESSVYLKDDMMLHYIQ